MDNKVCQSGGVFSEVVYGEILMKNASSHRIRHLLGAAGETRRAKLNRIEVEYGGTEYVK